MISRALIHLSPCWLGILTLWILRMWLLNQSMVNLKFVQGLLFLNHGILRTIWCDISSSKSISLGISSFWNVDIGRCLTNGQLLVILEHICEVALLSRLDTFLIWISVMRLALQRLERSHVALIFPWTSLALAHICRSIDIWHVDIVNIFIILVLRGRYGQLLSPRLARESTTFNWRLVLQVYIWLVGSSYQERVFMSCRSVLIWFYHRDFGALVSLLSHAYVLGMRANQRDVSSTFKDTLRNVLKAIEWRSFTLFHLHIDFWIWVFMIIWIFKNLV